jgi:Lipid A 3-O-deacylase (PagL)
MCPSMHACRVLTVLLVWSIATSASAQNPAPAADGAGPVAAASSRPSAADARASASTNPDTRTQYPLFLANAYFSASVGSIRYPFSERQLEPGYHAQSIEIPHLAARVDLFGRRLVNHLSAEVTYIRPARFVAYDNVNGDNTRRQVSAAIGGILLVSDAPVTRRLSVYTEGGLGITSRSAVEIDGRTALRAAHYSAALVGAGFTYRATANVDLVVGATYSPGRKSLSQPSTRLFTTGLRYRMRPLPASTVAENRRAGFAFPVNVIRLGYTTNLLGYAVNNVFTSDIPIFWGGRILTKRGLTLDYQHNVFHTKKRFAFDLGASASYWTSSDRREVFRTLSVYPLLRFFVMRTGPADVYATYSLAGPTYLTRNVIDSHDTGGRFTFQDFMSVGMFLGKSRRVDAEVGIKHYSNGNIFTRNAAIKIPLTLTLGLTF